MKTKIGTKWKTSAILIMAMVYSMSALCQQTNSFSDILKMCDAKDYKDAVPNLLVYIINNPKDIESHYQLGKGYEYLQKYDSAIIFYKQTSDLMNIKFLTINSHYPELNNAVKDCGMLKKVSCARDFLNNKIGSIQNENSSINTTKTDGKNISGNNNNPSTSNPTNNDDASKEEYDNEQETNRKCNQWLEAKYPGYSTKFNVGWSITKHGWEGNGYMGRVSFHILYYWKDSTWKSSEFHFNTKNFDTISQIIPSEIWEKVIKNYKTRENSNMYDLTYWEWAGHKDYIELEDGEKYQDLFYDKKGDFVSSDVPGSVPPWQK